MAASDVLLLCGSADRRMARRLAVRLDKRDVSSSCLPVDAQSEPPGLELLEGVQAVAVLVGQARWGPGTLIEIRALFGACLKRQLPFIPVYLPSAPEEPELPAFLHGITWVDLRAGWSRQRLDRLAWGITGRRVRRPR